MKQHLHLIDYALERGLKIRVVCGDEGDELQTLTDDKALIIEAVDAVEVPVMNIWGENLLGCAVIIEDGDDYTVHDHTDNDWFNSWYQCYERDMEELHKPGYQKRQSTQQLGDVADTWEVFEVDADGGEDVLAVVQTESLADRLIDSLSD